MMTPNQIFKAATKAEFQKGKILFEEYAESLNFDLGYQNFKAELQTMELQYKSPQGALLLCFTGDGSHAGCAGIRRLSENTAELKRLYVRPAYRSLKIGKLLLENAIEIASQLGYRFMRLDTVPGQEKAQELYRYLGFYEIASYRYSPIEGTIYFEKKLI